LDRFFGEVLGNDVESAMRQVYRTVAGSFVAYGHELTLPTGGTTSSVAGVGSIGCGSGWFIMIGGFTSVLTTGRADRQQTEDSLSMRSR
jgi:hypothetical protein